MEGEKDCEVGARLPWMVVSMKMRGVHRMRIAHWQRHPERQSYCSPDKVPRVSFLFNCNLSLYDPICRGRGSLSAGASELVHLVSSASYWSSFSYRSEPIASLVEVFFFNFETLKLAQRI